MWIKKFLRWKHCLRWILFGFVWLDFTDKTEWVWRFEFSKEQRRERRNDHMTQYSETNRHRKMTHFEWSVYGTRRRTESVVLRTRTVVVFECVRRKRHTGPWLGMCDTEPKQIATYWTECTRLTLVCGLLFIHRREYTLTLFTSFE